MNINQKNLDCSRQSNMSRITHVRSETFNDFNSNEMKRRKSLLLKAKNGSQPALKELKEKYNITALWDGKELIRL